MRRTAAQQAEAFPYNPAAVRQRHLTRNRRSRPHTRAGPCGEFLRTRAHLWRCYTYRDVLINDLDFAEHSDTHTHSHLIYSSVFIRHINLHMENVQTAKMRP